MLSRLPERLFLRSLLVRSVVFWIGVRLIEGATSLSAGKNWLVPLTPGAGALTVAIVGMLGALEAHRRNEHRFLANLGVSSSTIFLLAIVPAALMEIMAEAFFFHARIRQ